MKKNGVNDLLALSYVFCNMAAEGKTAEEIAVLGTFFTVVGDTLSLMAAKMALCQAKDGNKDDVTEKK